MPSQLTNNGVVITLLWHDPWTEASKQQQNYTIKKVCKMVSLQNGDAPLCPKIMPPTAWREWLLQVAKQPLSDRVVFVNLIQFELNTVCRKVTTIYALIQSVLKICICVALSSSMWNKSCKATFTSQHNCATFDNVRLSNENQRAKTQITRQHNHWSRYVHCSVYQQTLGWPFSYTQRLWHKGI